MFATRVVSSNHRWFVGKVFSRFNVTFATIDILHKGFLFYLL